VGGCTWQQFSFVGIFILNSAIDMLRIATNNLFHEEFQAFHVLSLSSENIIYPIV
jgi:hypothetical protein